jgi:hypothetical protein
MKANLVELESLLRSRKLDGTLVSKRPLPVERLASTGLADLDDALGGGLARGHLSEVVGPSSSGRTSVLCAVLAAATTRGEVVALIDAFDSFDPVSGHTAGVDLSRLLWIRGRRIGVRTTSKGMRGVQAVDDAIKASGLVCQAGQFGIVAIDLAEAPMTALRRLPFTTWRRLARAIEGSETVGVVVGPTTMGRSALGRSVVLCASEDSVRWSGTGPRSRVFRGLEIDARVESTRVPGQRFRLQAMQ